MPHEAELLQDVPSKPQVIWMWMASYFTHLAYGSDQPGQVGTGGTLPFPKTSLIQLQALCCKARGAVGCILTYCDVQVPFTYAHFIAVIVWVHNFLQAATSAYVIVAARNKKDYFLLGVEMFYLVFWPSLFLGLLQIGVGMMNPMRSSKGIDFPKGAYSSFIQSECHAFADAHARPPYGKPAAWDGARQRSPARGRNAAV